MNKLKVKKITVNEKEGTKFLELDNHQVLECKQNWFDTKVDEEDELIIIDGLNGNVVDDKSGIVINPDHLITITQLSSFNFCKRKVWLDSRFKSINNNESLLLGELVHALFQTCIYRTKITKEELYLELIKIIKEPENLKLLLKLNLEEAEVINNVKGYIGNILDFFKLYLYSDEPSAINKDDQNLKMKIINVNDIEDTLISTQFGLKGKVDVTMDVELHDRRGKSLQKSTPFELKTGKVSFSYTHQAQISLYALMLNTLAKCDYGLLAYLKENVDMKMIKVNELIKNGLLSQRNELVYYLKYLDANQPETRSNCSQCSECVHILDCCLIGKIYDPDKLRSFESFQPELVMNTLQHLSTKEVEFFKHWVDLVHVEEKFQTLERKGLFWQFNSIEMEKKEKGIAKLTLYKIREYSNEYIFKRSELFKSLGPLPCDNFTDCNERITLSIEDADGKVEKIGFVSGSIKQIDESFVEITLEEKLNKDFYSKIFRIDLMVYNQSFVNLFSPLLKLMSKDLISKYLRNTIISKKQPTFSQNLTYVQEQLIRQLSTLNNNQLKSVRFALKMDDYLLIKGNPGTGKTETIVAIVKVLAELKKTVIITAHTNKAVDNILLKLKGHVKFMRVGNLSKIHSDLYENSEDYLIQSCSSALELKKLYSSFNIFAGTCYSLNSHLIFNFRIIEYCIIDEASQLSFPESLIPLMKTKKFVLVGDNKQLPPIIKSPIAKSNGLETTLFDLLLDQDGTVELNVQYRMNEVVMSFANKLTYENKLVCANENVANATININISSKDEEIVLDSDSEGSIEEIASSWLEICLSNELDKSVIFLNTDKKWSSQHQFDNNGEIYNQFEINIILKILNKLIESNYPRDQIGIISPFNRQVKSLKSLSKMYNIETSTIDQYQGRDKDIILISCVKSAKDINVDAREILNDKRRINVALTRAKKKLILVGSRQTLTHYEPFKQFFLNLKKTQILNV